MAKAVKLADIAERVGVSTVTVSKALSGQKGVSEEVREKIRSIAEELGYQQPSAARKSQNQKSYNIGILISERFLDKYESFYWQMYQAVATRATAKECFTMLGGHRNARGRERQNAEAGTGTQGGWHYRYR